MHPDHSAGLTDMPNGQLLFPNAELVMHENEPAHWFDDGAMAKADERSRKLYFLAGREQVAPYKKRTRLFRQGEVFPGVTAVPSLGHTPGHTAYLVASGNDQLMIWGDTVHVPEVQTAFPEAGMAFDTDLAAAAASRKRMFDRVSADGILIAGMHLHFPAFSRLARRGDAYALVPEAWVSHDGCDLAREPINSEGSARLRFGAHPARAVGLLDEAEIRRKRLTADHFRSAPMGGHSRRPSACLKVPTGIPPLRRLGSLNSIPRDAGMRPALLAADLWQQQQPARDRVRHFVGRADRQHVAQRDQPVRQFRRGRSVE